MIRTTLHRSTLQTLGWTLRQKERKVFNGTRDLLIVNAMIYKVEQYFTLMQLSNGNVSVPQAQGANKQKSKTRALISFQDSDRTSWPICKKRECRFERRVSVDIARHHRRSTRFLWEMCWDVRNWFVFYKHLIPLPVVKELIAPKERQGKIRIHVYTEICITGKSYFLQQSNIFYKYNEPNRGH